MHRPLSIVVLDQPFESDCDEAALRRTEGLKARENGGIDVVKLPSFDLLYDSSTIRSGSYQSIKWGSDSYSTCAPSSLAHLTSCDDMSDYVRISISSLSLTWSFHSSSLPKLIY